MTVPAWSAPTPSCRRCGAPHEPGARFCWRCGAPLAGEDALHIWQPQPAAQNEAPLPRFAPLAAPAAQELARRQTPTAAPSHRVRWTLLWIVIGIVLVCVALSLVLAIVAARDVTFHQQLS